MLVEVKNLLYWKTEHGNADNCQDAPSYDVAQGLFAVADGAGTSLFPALWARILAQHFITTPLMSDDPFEVEWWVRLAQTEYKKRVPDIHKAKDFNVIQKLRTQGSDATLASLRITEADATTAQATFLVFGDSCILKGDPEKQTISSFILKDASEFDRAPICVPSDLKYFNRDFHRCQTSPVVLDADDQIIIATDAVARWILARGDRAKVWAAFQQVYHCSVNDWPDFVNAVRQRKEMVNDDSTALVLTFYEDSAARGTSLGFTKEHTREVIALRQNAFEEARHANNKELLAISYGDGNDLRPVITPPLIDDVSIEYARDVANALKEVLNAFRQAQNNPGLVQKVKPFWDKYGHLLQNEPCAANLRETLCNNGVIPQSPVVVPPVQTPIVIVEMPKIPDKFYEPEIPTPSPDQVKYEIDPALADTVYLYHPSAAQNPSPPAIDRLAQQKQHDLELELAKKQRAEKFFSAYHEKNEEKMIKTYEELQKEGDRETLAHIDINDRQKFDRIIRQKAAQARFEQMLQQRFYPKTLLAAYYSAKEATPQLSLSPQESEIVTLAHKFMDAWYKNDPYILERAYRDIDTSSFSTKFTFTPEEMEKYDSARKYIQKQKNEMQYSIVRVGEDSISRSAFISTYIIKKLYIRYIKSQISYRSPTEATEYEYVSNSLKEQLASGNLLRIILEELINSKLIREGIKSEDPVALTQQFRMERQQLADALQRYEKEWPDDLFRRQELDATDLLIFAQTVVAPNIFANYLESKKKRRLVLSPQIKKSVLDDWLRERHEHIFFGEANYDFLNSVEISRQLEQYIEKYIFHVDY